MGSPQERGSNWLENSEKDRLKTMIPRLDALVRGRVADINKLWKLQERLLEIHQIFGEKTTTDWFIENNKTCHKFDLTATEDLFDVDSVAAISPWSATEKYLPLWHGLEYGQAITVVRVQKKALIEQTEDATISYGRALGFKFPAHNRQVDIFIGPDLNRGADDAIYQLKIPYVYSEEGLREAFRQKVIDKAQGCPLVVLSETPGKRH
jgi:hypothetical protein